MGHPTPKLQLGRLLPNLLSMCVQYRNSQQSAKNAVLITVTPKENSQSAENQSVCLFEYPPCSQGEWHRKSHVREGCEGRQQKCTPSQPIVGAARGCKVEHAQTRKHVDHAT